MQPPEPGVVREIHVKDGDLVAAGDLLVLFDQTGAAADVARLGLGKRDCSVRRRAI